MHHKRRTKINKVSKQIISYIKNYTTWSTIIFRSKINLRTYNSILKKVIRQAKTAYFASTFNRCKHDTEKTWQTINKVISKSAKINNFPTHFTDDNKTFDDNQDIANRFNAFFINVGPNQANATYNVKNDHLTYYIT